MRIQFKYSLIPLILVLIAGCASAPSAPTAAVANTAPAAKSTAAPVASVARETAAIRKTAHLLGLAPRSKNGTELYCRSAAEIGTRVESVVCYTSAQVLELEKRTQSNQDDVEALRRASLTEPNKH